MGDLAIGIDLGTTYCCVAVYRDGRVEIIPNGVGTNTTPSYVHIDEDEFVTVGTAAKGKALQDPTTAVYDVKRLIGRRFDDPIVQKDMEIWPFKVIEDEDTYFPRIRLNETSYLPEQISAHVLEYLKKCAEEWLNCPVKKAVITVPAYFTEAQRHATKLAGAMAGLDVLNLVHEPTSAAVFSCYQNKSFQTDKTILVFDLGGGTFDVVVMAIKDRKIQIKAIGGNSHLGGQDIDRKLVDHCLQDFKEKNAIDLTYVGSESDKIKVARLLRRLKNECEEIKLQLSYTEKSVITLNNVHGDTSLAVKITRKEFDKLNDALFQQCVNTVKAVVKEANLTPGDIDEVIMVGGSSRILKVQELVMGIFEDKKPNRTTINVDEAVACGAAIQAALLTADCPALRNIFPDIKIRETTSSPVDKKQFTRAFNNAQSAGAVCTSKMKTPNPSSTPHKSNNVNHSESEYRKEAQPSISEEISEVEVIDEFSEQLQIIANGSVRKVFDSEVIQAWCKIYEWTNGRPPDCERFLVHRGIETFLNCLKAFPYEPNLPLHSFGTFVNVAVFKRLRPQLMTSELINAFYNFLDSTVNHNRDSYRAAYFLTHILSDGEAAWTIEYPRRADVLIDLGVAFYAGKLCLQQFLTVPWGGF